MARHVVVLIFGLVVRRPNAQWGNPAIPSLSTHIFLRGGPWRVEQGSSANFLTEDITVRSGEVTKWSDKYGMRIDLVLD